MTDGPKRYQTFFAELKRHHVFRVAAVLPERCSGCWQRADLTDN